MCVYAGGSWEVSSGGEAQNASVSNTAAGRWCGRVSSRHCAHGAPAEALGVHRLKALVASAAAAAAAAAGYCCRPLRWLQSSALAAFAAFAALATGTKVCIAIHILAQEGHLPHALLRQHAHLHQKQQATWVNWGHQTMQDWSR